MPKAVTSKSNPRRNAKLRKLAVNLRHGRKRWDTLQKDWTANTMRMARWMGEARKEFASNNAFSVWLRDNKIGYSNDERMALIEFSNRDSEEIRKFLESAKSRSLRRLLDNLRSDERSPSSYATKTFHLHHPPVQTTDLPPYRLEAPPSTHHEPLHVVGTPAQPSRVGNAVGHQQYRKVLDDLLSMADFGQSAVENSKTAQPLMKGLVPDLNSMITQIALWMTRIETHTGLNKEQVRRSLHVIEGGGNEPT